MTYFLIKNTLMAARLFAFPLLLRGSQARTSQPGQQTMQPAEWSSCDLLSDLSPPAECASIGPIAACSLGSPCRRTCCLQINPPASATTLQAAESGPYPASTAYPSRIQPYFSQSPSRVLRTKEIDNASCPLLPDCWSEACPTFSQLNCFTYGGWVRTPPLPCHAARHMPPSPLTHVLLPQDSPPLPPRLGCTSPPRSQFPLRAGRSEAL